MPYVYVYLDPRKPGIFEYGDYKFDYEPFYVGYGSQQTRMRAHLRDAKKHKGSEHPKFAKIHKIWAEGLDPILIQYQKNLSREKACELEHNMVITIGRQDLKKGPLTNLTDAGETNLNRSYKPRPQPTRTREKIRDTLKQKYIDHPELREKPFSQDTRKKISAGLIKAYAAGKKMPVTGGWKLSEEVIKEMSERSKLQKHPTGINAANWSGWAYDPQKNISYATAKLAARYEQVANGTILWRIQKGKWKYLQEPQGTQVFE